MPTTPSALSRFALCDAEDDPPFSVGLYMDDFRDCLDARHFATVRLSGDANAARDGRHGLDCHSGVGVWKKR